MPGYTASHLRDDEDTECPEIVGSVDLRETFKEHTRVRGSFAINGFMFTQFETNGIENLLWQLNEAKDQTYVVASIDDGYHLVLEAMSVSPIVITKGPAYVDQPSVSMSDAGEIADEVVEKLKAEAKRDADQGHGPNENRVLELLGLSETEHEAEGAPPRPGVPPPGLTAEQRKAQAAAEGRRSGPPSERDGGSWMQPS